jgi:Domain of unknown function (DUF4266)
VSDLLPHPAPSAPSATKAGLRATLALCTLALVSGCTITPVQPWEKGLLAKPGMRFGPDRLENRYAEHIYSSKEGASGGASVGGGGCGCN